MASIALSTRTPTVGCLAWAWRPAQRASGGTQKTLSAAYSSRSSGSAPACRRSLERCSSKASEMYLRKTRPRTTCLYSAASIEPRSLSAASQSFSSKPSAAPLLVVFLRAMCVSSSPLGLHAEDLAGLLPRLGCCSYISPHSHGRNLKVQVGSAVG